MLFPHQSHTLQVRGWFSSQLLWLPSHLSGRIRQFHAASLKRHGGLDHGDSSTSRSSVAAVLSSSDHILARSCANPLSRRSGRGAVCEPPNPRSIGYLGRRIAFIPGQGERERGSDRARCSARRKSTDRWKVALRAAAIHTAPKRERGQTAIHTNRTHKRGQAAIHATPKRECGQRGLPQTIHATSV